MKKLILKAALVFLPGMALAQTAPNGPMTVINPFTVGGLTDLVARMLIEKSHDSFPQGAAVVSKPGAGGAVGITAVLASPADGRTIGFSPSGAIVTPPQMVKSLQYKNPDDIRPIINVFSSYQLLAVNGNSKWHTAQEFISDVKASPAKYSIGYTGQGSASHLNLAQLIKATAIDVADIPYQGWSQSSVALLGDHIDALVINAGEARSLINDNKMRVLGVFNDVRVPYYPETPTFKELGYDIGVKLNFFFFGPKKLSDGLTDYIHDAIKHTMDDEEFHKFLVSREVAFQYMNGEDTKKMLWSEYRLHTGLLKDLGLLNN